MIAFEVAIERKWDVHIVLPCDESDFKRESLKNDPTLLRRFDSIISGKSVFVMDLPPQEFGENQYESAYRAAALVTVYYSDVLLAVPEGSEPKSAAGTAATILKA